MAAKASAKYPHKWPDGSYHSIPWEQTKRAQAGAVVAPPPGTYDPNLDAELGKNQRGLQDLLADIGGGTGDDPLGIGRVRSQDDFALGLGEIEQARSRGLADYNTSTGNLETGYNRNLSDLLKSREQGTQDYGTNVATLQRNYLNQGVAQGEAQRKAGAFAGSGAAAQSARKRTANEAIDRAPIDTAYSRFIDASQTGQSRLGEDRRSGLDALKLAYDRGDADLAASGLKLGTAFTRQDQDWATQLERAKREAGAFGDDVLNAKVAQFLQNNPGRTVPIIYPDVPTVSAPPPAPGMSTLGAGPGFPGSTLKKKKNKRGQTIGTYTNSVTGP
jgi:hypothetical protein